MTVAVGSSLRSGAVAFSALSMTRRVAGVRLIDSQCLGPPPILTPSGIACWWRHHLPRCVPAVTELGSYLRRLQAHRCTPIA